MICNKTVSRRGEAFVRFVTIAPNSELTFTAMYNFSTTPLPAGSYYVKFKTTSGYTIQSPTVYVS